MSSIKGFKWWVVVIVIFTSLSNTLSTPLYITFEGNITLINDAGGLAASQGVNIGDPVKYVFEVDLAKDGFYVNYSDDTTYRVDGGPINWFFANILEGDYLASDPDHPFQGPGYAKENHLGNDFLKSTGEVEGQIRAESSADEVLIFATTPTPVADWNESSKMFLSEQAINSTGITTNFHASLTPTVISNSPPPQSGINCPDKGWIRKFGEHSYYNHGTSVTQTFDGGYALTGFGHRTVDNDGDILVVKTNSQGTQEWIKHFGYPGNNKAFSIVETRDTGYAIAGFSDQFGNGDKDVFIAKLDSKGNLLWTNTFGTGFNDEAYEIKETSDGGFIVAGFAKPNDFFQAYLIKTDSLGEEVWQNTYNAGHCCYAVGRSVEESPNGGFVLAGEILISGRNKDVLMIKVDANGNQIWNRKFGTIYQDQGHSIKKTSDNGYVIWGTYLLKTDMDGNLIWEKTFGGSARHSGRSVFVAEDGSIAMFGLEGTQSASLIISDSEGNERCRTIMGGVTGYSFSGFSGIINSEGKPILVSTSSDLLHVVLAQFGDRSNNGPVANAGQDQILSDLGTCEAQIHLDGSQSYDPVGVEEILSDGAHNYINELEYSWSDSFGTQSGEMVDVSLPVGNHNITLTVSDVNGGQGTDEVTVLVEALDSDGDGIPDCPDDNCPFDSNKVEPGFCGCGVSEFDSDNDESPDCIDECFLDPLKVTPGICGCDITDTDTDNDGIADCLDNCPADANPDQSDSDSNGVGDVCEICKSDPITGNITPSKSKLWPPNHKMESITLDVSSLQAEHPNTTFIITSVSITELNKKHKNCHKFHHHRSKKNDPDYKIVGDLEVQLRKEKLNHHSGRIYTIHVTATNCSGSYELTTDVKVSRKKTKRHKRKKRHHWWYKRH